MLDFSLDSKNKLLNQRYFLYETIAKTEHSHVFLARDIVKHRKCVIKQLNPFSSAITKPIVRSMFDREAEISSKLAGKHDRICQFYDYFHEAGDRYIVQEWVPGITLEKLRSLRKLSEAEIKKLLLDLLPVLECIHGLGIVHCDIKPNNIILRSSDNLPVLIDFGVAQYCSDRHPPTIVGTPGYMSLEQAMGQATYNNDLCSLGLTAIYLLTGKSPQTVNFEHYKPSFSSDLVESVERAIATDPQRRFTSATQMRLALQSSSASSVTKRDRFLLKSGIACLIILAGAWLGWRYLTDSPNEQLPINLIDSFPEESLLPAEDLEDPEDPEVTELINDLKTVIFIPGTSQTEITRALGEPVWRKPGFWANSMAWSYENMILPKIDLGYIFDIQTGKLRQVEIAVPPSTNVGAVRAALSAFLAAPLTAELEQGLQEVYHRQKPSHSFVAGDLEGIIQRNHKDRIYIAVWFVGFH